MQYLDLRKEKAAVSTWLLLLLICILVGCRRPSQDEVAAGTVVIKGGAVEERFSLRWRTKVHGGSGRSRLFLH